MMVPPRHDYWGAFARRGRRAVPGGKHNAAAKESVELQSLVNRLALALEERAGDGVGRNTPATPEQARRVY
jgi:hypothetical protein